MNIYTYIHNIRYGVTGKPSSEFVDMIICRVPSLVQIRILLLSSVWIKKRSLVIAMASKEF